MDYASISSLVADELGQSWREKSLNGISLKDAVVAPFQSTIRDVYGSGETLSVWVLLETAPGTEEGMFVAFDPSLKRFCLAEHAPEGEPYVLAFHPTFRAATEAM